MRLDQKVIEKLPLSVTASEIVVGQLDRMPPLLADRCLAGCASEVVIQAAARLASELQPVGSLLTMPRRVASAPRPVLIPSTGSRVAYESLVRKLQERLPDTTKTPETREAWRTLPLETDAEYVVEIDIAACYEYIDHDLLAEELLLHSGMPAHVAGIREYLTELLGVKRGLPQLNAASDALAEPYLERLARELRRDGHEVVRYVDDFRIPANDWDTANRVIEDAAEYARKLGLILSSEKSRVMRAETYRRRDKASEELFDRYFAAATDALTRVQWIQQSYDEGELIEVAPERQEAAAAATRALVLDWHEAAKRSKQEPLSGSEADSSLSLMTDYLSGAIAFLSGEQEGLSNEVLSDIVFFQPLRLQQIAEYVIGRQGSIDGPGAGWAALAHLSGQGRQSPWSKIWLLHVMDALPSHAGQDQAQCLAWVKDQLSDKHEIVRAEAAWRLAVAGTLTSDSVRVLYRAASEVTAHALAAAAQRAPAVPEDLVKMLAADGPLHKAAAAWAAEQA